MELITRDTSKLDKKTPVTTDENLFEISRLKEKVQQQFVKCIKETSIDCSVYAGSEELTCFSAYLIYDSFCFYRSRTSPKSSVGEATSLLSLLLIMVSNNPLYSFLN